MQKLSVERAELKNGVFTCECWIGDEELMPKTVCFAELVRHMGGIDGNVPVNDNDRETDEYYLPLMDWIGNKSHFDLCWELAQCINRREGRTEFEPPKTDDNNPFLPVSPLTVIHRLNAA